MADKDTKMNMLAADELDVLFQAARATAPLPSQALWDRVHKDSAAHQPAPPKIRARSGAPRPRRIAGLLRVFGGWGLAGGLACATFAGLWIGYAHPEIVPRFGTQNALAGGGFWAAQSFELEDFEPGLDGLSALLEDG